MAEAKKVERLVKDEHVVLCSQDDKAVSKKLKKKRSTWIVMMILRMWISGTLGGAKASRDMENPAVVVRYGNG